MTSVINIYNAPSVTDAQSQQAYIQAIQTLIAATKTALADTTITRDQANAERETLYYASALLLLAQEDAGPLQSVTSYTMGPDDDVRYVAQEFLGSALRYKDILALNGFVNCTIPVGTILTLPAS